MIQKIQRLKAKKGFTLVELIVVIAIIGVLAAILVPTMMGFVQKSQITSANNSAATVSKAAKAWLTELDAKGQGMKQSATNIEVFTLTFTDGNLVVTVAGGSGFTAANFNKQAPTITGTADPLDTQTYFKAVLSDLKNAKAVVYLEGGNVIGVSLVNDPASTATLPVATDFKAGTFAFEKDGLLTSGDICGTYPTLVKS